MSVIALLPEPKQQYSNSLGFPLIGGKLFTYAAGTSNPMATFTDAAGTTQQANPIILNTRGEPASPIYWNGNYRVELRDALNNLIYTVDNYNSDPAGIGSLTSATLGFKQTGTGSVQSNVQAELGRSFFIGQFSTPAQAVVAAAGGRLFIGSGESVTLNVPTQFSTIQAALSALAGWIIHGSAKIKCTDASVVLTGPVNLNHPYGQNITIEGNVASPNLCSFFGSDPPTFDLFVVSNGNKFGLITGVTANLANKPTQANNYTAFLALNGASMGLKNVNSNNWYYGVAGRNGASIKYDTGTVTNAGDVGVWSFAGGNIQCVNVASNNASDAANSLGFGFQAEFGGVIEAQGCSATGCLVAGMAALSNGTGRYYNCTVNANTGSGFMSRGGGQVEANGSSTTNNLRYGIEITEYGNIVNLTTNTGNTLGNANAFPYFDVSTGSARVAASIGQLRLDTNGAFPVYFNTGGGAQLEVRHAANAVNHVYVQGGATGSPAIIGASGTDPVTDLELRSTGAGSYVKFNAGYFSPAPAADGYFTIRLTDGGLYDIPVHKR